MAQRKIKEASYLRSILSTFYLDCLYDQLADMSDPWWPMPNRTKSGLTSAKEQRMFCVPSLSGWKALSALMM